MREKYNYAYRYSIYRSGRVDGGNFVIWTDGIKVVSKSEDERILLLQKDNGKMYIVSVDELDINSSKFWGEIRELPEEMRIIIALNLIGCFRILRISDESGRV